MFFLALTIRFLWPIPAKLSTRINISRRNILLNGESTSKPQHKTKPFPPSSNSGESSSKTRKKKSNATCTFCGGLRHVEYKCWLKLEALNEAMRQHKISVPKPSSTSKGHALSTQSLYAFSDSWIFDYGASHHMTHSHELLASISKCNISQITVGDST
jgi:hypothetical protein